MEEPNKDKKEPSEIKTSDVSPVKRKEQRCIICGATGWCSCGYGPEHGYGSGRYDPNNFGDEP